MFWLCRVLIFSSLITLPLARHTRTRTHTRTRARARAHTRGRTHACTHACTHARTHARQGDWTDADERTGSKMLLDRIAQVHPCVCVCVFVLCVSCASSAHDWQHPRNRARRRTHTHVSEVRPALHVFGHIHSGHGVSTLPGCPTLFVRVVCTRACL